MNTPNIFDRLSRKIHHHSDMEPHESDSGPPFGEVEPLNFQDEESVVHTVLEFLTKNHKELSCLEESKIVEPLTSLIRITTERTRPDNGERTN